jgi:xylulokinase
MYLGIDLGTSGVKVLLLDDAQRIVAVADAPLTVSRPQPQWSEQHPQQWWDALDAAMRRLASLAPQALAAVRAIGLSGQMHGAVLLDAAGDVLRPAILWNDGRSVQECAELEAAMPPSRRITGNLAMPGFTAPKLLWLRRHEPQVFAATRRVLLPKDWLRLRLTGEAISEMSDASGTLWLDVAQRRWSEAMLDACGLGVQHMPRLVEGSQRAGTLRADVAHAWGLRAGIAVAGGAGDNAASAIGIGASRAGQGFVSLGTSGVVFEVIDAYRCAPERAVHAFAHALPGRWHLMAVMLSAASALAWATRLTGLRSEAALVAEAAALSRARRERAPLFLPYLGGERTPHNDAQASGVLMGLRHEHAAADIGHAVMEGVAFGLADGLAALHDAASGESAGALSLVGGGARSDAWAQLIASTLGRVLERPTHAHAAAALGAARLAWLADGASEDEVCPPERDVVRFEPRDDEAELLRPRHARFRALYTALRSEFSR